MPGSLFIGRWQPFHMGHQEIIERVLAEGRDVVVAIRDTVKSHSNPYSVEDRRAMIERALGCWGSQVTVIVIPDVDEICYGRSPGWGVREIVGSRPDISGTKLRARDGL